MKQRKKIYSEIMDEMLNRVRPALQIMGCFAIVAYLLYYVIFTYWIPQKYESLTLRLVMCVLCLGWVFQRKLILSKTFKKYYPSYLILSTFFCGPYYFSFMLLKNDISVLWLLFWVIHIYLIYYLIHNYFLVLIMSLLGFSLAYIQVVYLLGEYVSLSGLKTEYLTAIIFAYVGGFFLSYKTEAALKRKISLLKSLSGSISHELRHPLTVISLSNQQAIRYLDEIKPLDDKDVWPLSQNDFDFLKSIANKINRSINQGDKIASLILKNIRHEHINASSFRTLQMKPIIEEVINTYPFKPDENHSSVLNTSPESDFKFYGDDTLMYYIFYNLIRNAIFYFKNNSEGLLRIGIKSHNRVNMVWVEDNGPGIDKKRIPYLFESFLASDKKEGTGLGLPFCKGVMNAFGGDIICKSDLGKGARFEMTFPAIKDRVKF